jgi:hypothetical protein
VMNFHLSQTSNQDTSRLSRPSRSTAKGVMRAPVPNRSSTSYHTFQTHKVTRHCSIHTVGFHNIMHLSAIWRGKQIISHLRLPTSHSTSVPENSHFDKYSRSEIVHIHVWVISGHHPISFHLLSHSSSYHLLSGIPVVASGMRVHITSPLFFLPVPKEADLPK